MIQILFSLSIAILAFIVFLFFMIKAIKRKNKKRVFISLTFLLVVFIFSFWTVYLLSVKSYNKMSKFFEPRTGFEIYTSLFGKPDSDCLIVRNKKDQIVPRLDCCIWLEFQTCPDELNRVISKDTYKMSKYSKTDTLFYNVSYSPKPEWWKPYLLSDSIFVLRKSNGPNHSKILIFSQDSTHAFYCDMAD